MTGRSIAARGERRCIASTTGTGNGCALCVLLFVRIVDANVVVVVVTREHIVVASKEVFVGVALILGGNDTMQIEADNIGARKSSWFAITARGNPRRPRDASRGESMQLTIASDVTVHRMAA